MTMTMAPENRPPRSVNDMALDELAVQIRKLPYGAMMELARVVATRTDGDAHGASDALLRWAERRPEPHYPPRIPLPFGATPIKET